MNHNFILMFAIYLAVMTAIGWFVSRKKQSGKDFLLADRSLPLLLTLGTTVATMVGTGSSMGAVGFAYHSGWAGMLYGIGGALGILLLAWWFAPVRQLKFMTMSEELAFYVGAKPFIRHLIAVIIFTASIGWLGAHIIGGGMYLSWLTGMDKDWAKVVIAISFLLYVMIGGYTAVVWTDSIQALILFVGFILMAYFSLQAVGGWTPMLAAQPVDNISWFAIDKIGVVPAISLALVVLVGILGTPSFRQRIYSGKNVGSVRCSFVCSGLLYLLFSCIPAIIGMSAFALSGHLDNASYAFPHMALNVMPLGFGGLVIVAGISATMSSASSDAIAAVSVVLRDLFKMVRGKMPEPEQVVSLSRWSLLITILLALSFALTSNNIIDYIGKMIAILMSGLCVCSVLGRFWPRFNWQGMIAALASASATALTITLEADWNAWWGNPVIPSLLVSMGCGVAVSLVTVKCQVSAEQASTILSNEREYIEKKLEKAQS